MQRERVTDDIIVFISDRYAQVTATVVILEDSVILFDTLVYPDETREIRKFIRQRLGLPVKYVVNTHFHADHTTGTCFFPEATVIAHQKCRELLDTRGRRSLEASRVQVPEMEAVDLVLPDVVFEKSLTLYQGKKTLHLWHTPGHSPDSIVCLVEPDRVLIAADTLMPIPFFQDGDDEQFLISLMALQAESYEAIIQGHGEVILRGEVEEKFAEDINYLKCLHQSVDRVLAQAKPQVEADTIDIETCGKSRVLLNGMVEELHRQNVQMLLKKRQNLVQTRTSVT